MPRMATVLSQATFPAVPTAVLGKVYGPMCIPDVSDLQTEQMGPDHEGAKSEPKLLLLDFKP